MPCSLASRSQTTQNLLSASNSRLRVITKVCESALSKKCPCTHNMQLRACLPVGNESGSGRSYFESALSKRTNSKRAGSRVAAVDRARILSGIDLKSIIRGSPHLFTRLQEMPEHNGTLHKNGATVPDIPPSSMPKHVAIILDGNRRWAKQQGMSSCLKGHEAGVQTLKTVAARCQELGIRALTVFAFSTENWQRSTTEVNGILQLLESTIASGLDELCDAGVKLTLFGELDRLSPSLQAAIAR